METVIFGLCRISASTSFSLFSTCTTDPFLLHLLSISGAAAVVCLDLFQRGSPPSVLHEERREVLNALATLRSLSSFSSIAARGAGLIDNLLTEESRLPPIPSVAGTTYRTNGFGGQGEGENDERMSKKRKTGDDLAPIYPPQHLTSPPSPARNRASLSNLLVSPDANTSLFHPSGLVGANGRSASPSSSAHPHLHFHPHHHFDSSFATFDDSPAPASLPPMSSFDHYPHHTSTASNGGGGMKTPNGLGLVDEVPLPSSFMSAFVEAGTSYSSLYFSSAVKLTFPTYSQASTLSTAPLPLPLPVYRGLTSGREH